MMDLGSPQGAGVVDGDVDYDAIARAAEATEVPIPPLVADEEVRTHGPVIIDTVHGGVRDAETGDQLIAPIQRPGAREREIDLSLVAITLFGIAILLACVAAVAAPLTPSQKFLLLALAIALAAERLWWEIRRTSQSPTAPEGVIYASRNPEFYGEYDESAGYAGESRSSPRNG